MQWEIEMSSAGNAANRKVIQLPVWGENKLHLQTEKTKSV